MNLLTSTLGLFGANSESSALDTFNQTAGNSNMCSTETGSSWAGSFLYSLTTTTASVAFQMMEVLVVEKAAYHAQTIGVNVQILDLEKEPESKFNNKKNIILLAILVTAYLYLPVMGQGWLLTIADGLGVLAGIGLALDELNFKHSPTYKFLKDGLAIAEELDTYNLAENTIDSQICTICIENFEPRDRVWSHKAVNGKSHYFHTKCMRTWLETTQMDPNCPLCRTLIKPITAREINAANAIIRTFREYQQNN